ncbi:MAG: hypothetical protein H6739_03975 [Alphaproteobacteria bacterium]|nr:hypothetical protein [Alphaproteobacteria bacterium]
MLSLTLPLHAAEPAGFDAVPWGQALPSAAVVEHDPPWAGAEGVSCGWVEDLLLCDGPEGRGVTRAYRRSDALVEDGEVIWLRTAGLEWSVGRYVELGAPEGFIAFSWGPPRPPAGGWVGVERAQTAPPRPAASPRAVRVEGIEALGPAGPGVQAALSRCGGASVERLPAAVLYDATGEARLVRFQTFPPPEEVELGCVAAALGAPGRPPGTKGAVEVMVTLGQPL